MDKECCFKDRFVKNEIKDSGRNFYPRVAVKYLGGFYILEHLKVKTGINFVP